MYHYIFYIFYVYRYLIVCKWYYKLDWDFRLLNFVYIFSNGFQLKEVIKKKSVVNE